MKRISEMTPEQVLAYNLRDGGTAVAVFEDTQPERVLIARRLVSEIIGRNPRHKYRIIELGCGAGDISGPFSHIHDVLGVEIVPGAADLARSRFPQMTVVEGDAEQAAVIPCDILILTEFLEHVVAPVDLAREWLLSAANAVIGHPLNDPGGLEQGHLWSYDEGDFHMWHEIGGHREIRTERFSLPPFPGMILGSSERIR